MDGSSSLAVLKKASSLQGALQLVGQLLKQLQDCNEAVA